MKRSLVALIVVGTVVSHRVAAQAIAPAALVNRPQVADTTQRFTNTDSFLLRSLTGALGFVGGAAVGFGLAAATGPHGCGGCDDPGLAETVAGIAFGGALGASLAASAPKLRAQCSFGARMLRSTAGSVVGSVLGTAISLNVDGGPVGLPIGAVLGASTALIGC